MAALRPSVLRVVRLRYWLSSPEQLEYLWMNTYPAPIGCSGHLWTTNDTGSPALNSTVTVRHLPVPCAATTLPGPNCGWRTVIPTENEMGNSTGFFEPFSRSAPVVRNGALGRRIPGSPR